MTFHHLIIPLDGSRLAESVLPTAQRLARDLHAAVTLIHVIERNPPREIHGEAHLSTPGEAEVYLQHVAERFFADHPVSLHVHTEAITDVPRAIADHAREFGSDLVIMCTHGRGGLKQWLFGSIAQQVAAARLPVLLVRPEADGTAPQPNGGPFLVPLDGTPLREAALPMAAALAKACRTPLILLRIIPTPDPLRSSSQALLAFEQEDAADYLQQLAQPLGLPIRPRIRIGDTGEIIIQEARTLAADWIIMATTTRTGMDAFWSGSVAPKVAGSICRPLLLIPGEM